MALADIIINDGQGTPVAHTFQVLQQINGRTIRSDLSRSPELPLMLSIGHQVQKKGGYSVDSHLWRIDETILDGDGVTIYPANVRIMVDCPRPVYSDGMADNFAAYTRNFFTSANMRLLMRGSMF